MISIVQGGIEDLAAIELVMAAAFDPDFGEAWTHSQCMGMLMLPNTQLLLALKERRIIGFALARYALDEAELLLIAVDPAHQKSGIGHILIKSVTDWARLKGAKVLFLEVRTGNPAMSLYSRAEFVQCGMRKDYYRGAGGQLIDAITLKKTIDWQD